METEGLNKNHRRRLVTTYQYVDKILSEIEGILRATQSNSPFETYVADAAPVQSRVVEDYIFRIREAMIRFLRDHDIAPDNPRISAIWAARASLVQAGVSITELGPEYMRGYGELSPQSAGELTEMVFELQNLFNQVSNYLSRQIDNDPLARLEKLEEITDEISLLKELGRIIQVHGLVELRSTFALLAGQAESVNFEIAVFGRVSSGKSSLLNYILKTDALPVGITPVTAIPIHIGHGEEPAATIHFAESKPLKTELRLVSEYAAEQQNPGNHKHVTGINIDIPNGQLKKGVKFVDTPGLGSLAASGAAETLAYLPRCDLGLVLIDAGATLNQEDLNILRLLSESGADTMVLLSKADLLTPEERDRMVDYIRTQITRNMKMEIPVFPVSAYEPELTNNWFQLQLLPLFDRQRELANLSLRRKLLILSETVQSILRNRLEQGKKPPSPGQSQQRKKILQSIKEGSKLVDETKDKCRMLTGEIESLVDPIIKETAVRLAGIWAANKARQIQAGEILSRVLLETISGLDENLARRLTETKTRLTEILKELAAISSLPDPDTDGLPECASLPVLAVSPGELQLYLDRPFLSFIGPGFLYRHSLAVLKRSGINLKLRDILAFYAGQLNRWSQDSLQKLGGEFETKSDYYQAEIVSSDHPASNDVTAEQISGDLDVLSSWPVLVRNKGKSPMSNV